MDQCKANGNVSSNTNNNVMGLLRNNVVWIVVGLLVVVNACAVLQVVWNKTERNIVNGRFGLEVLVHIRLRNSY